MTGLGHARNRDYSASLGRLIQRDPIRLQPGDNDWYRFVGNGPTGKTDRSGLMFAWDRHDTACNTQQRGAPQKPVACGTTADEEAAWRTEWAYHTEDDRTDLRVLYRFTAIPHPPRDLDTHGMINFPHYR